LKQENHQAGSRIKNNSLGNTMTGQKFFNKNHSPQMILNQYYSWTCGKYFVLQLMFLSKERQLSSLVVLHWTAIASGFSANKRADQYVIQKISDIIKQ
jgi:hypothetical protein